MLHNMVIDSFMTSDFWEFYYQDTITKYEKFFKTDANTCE